MLETVLRRKLHIPILREAVSCGMGSAYARRLLAAVSTGVMERAGRSTAESIIRPPGQRSRRKPTLVEPLSEREIEVLQRIAEGLSNREIAERLYLSPHTIKVHTRNIYGKLGVNSRTQAVAKARTLGMLQGTAGSGE